MVGTTSVGIFFGSETGNTAYAAERIGKAVASFATPVVQRIEGTKKAEFLNYRRLILGTPTYYYGDLQCDWEDFLAQLRDTTFENSCIALFGCGDQVEYSDTFCDGIGLLYAHFKKAGAHLIGRWPRTGYRFSESKALLQNDNEMFVGLPLDEENQADQSSDRITNWVRQLSQEFRDFV